jgi:hypothetical protein
MIDIVKMFNNLLNKKNLFLFLLIIIIFYRSPYILLEGRFLAEEGFFWYKNILLNGQFSTLILIQDISGYFHLWMNIAAFFSGLVTMEKAPLVTVYFSFFLLVYILFYIINSKSDFLPTNNTKYIACMIVLFSPVMTSEVWLNSLNAMSYLGILSFFILLESSHSSIFKKINFIFLFISGLSGFYSSGLLPLFFIKYIYYRTKTNLLNFIIILFTAVIQISLAFISTVNNEITSERFYLGSEKIINYIYNVILKALFGREILQSIMSLVNLNFLIFVSLLFVSILFIYLFKFLITKKDYALRMIVLAFIIESFIILIGSAYKDSVGGRYQVVSGVIFSFIFLRLYLLENNKIKKFLSGSIILFFLTIGFVEFKYNALYPEFLSCIECPKWKKEVEKWKVDKKYHLKIWPYPMQKMQLY